MLRPGTPGSVTTVADVPDHQNERSVRRLRLTLHPGESKIGQRSKTENTDDKALNGRWKKKNGFIRERPAGRESPVDMEEHHGGLANGVSSEAGLASGGGPKVYGVVQRRSGESQEQEVMARHWSINHLQDEMKYIREVRDSLEKVREKMYGQFGGMQQSVEKLSRELKAANSHKRSLESEVRVRTAAMESFDQMNTNLISANIDLQKSLLSTCHDRVGTRDELRSMRGLYERSEVKLREQERQLAAAQEENRTLKRQAEVSREAGAQALRDMSSRLQQQYEERLQEQQRKHTDEIEALQAQIDVYVKRIEELERNAKIAEAKIAERDQRISALERLLDCMGVERSQLTQKLQDTEQRLQQLQHMEQQDPTVNKRAEQLEEEAAELKERIKHLNDMVFSQQRKVKKMIEEVEQLRSKVAQKDMFISELLDRLAIVECENNELEDKLKYFMSVQSAPEKDKPQTRDIGLGCDIPITRSVPSPSTQRESPLLSNHIPPAPLTGGSISDTLPLPTRPRPSPPNSRLSNTLLRYTPGQYSQYLQNSQSPSLLLRDQAHTPPSSLPVADFTVSDSSIQTSSPASPSSEDMPTLSPVPPVRTAQSRVYTPFMRLMEISAKLNIE